MTLSHSLPASVFVFLFACLISWAGASSSTAYHERLVLQPLPPAQLLASFNFRSNASASSYAQQHFQYFPRSLGQILQFSNTKELHLRFSTGRWDSEKWGQQPWSGTKEGGTGVELWAWVEAENDEEAFAYWTTLNNALAGLFCASINFIDSTRTTRPVMSFEPTGDHSAFRDTSASGAAPGSNLHLLHGMLPREVVCTENLTPFLKLLPCKGKAGIASLLDGHKLFDASWQTMSIDVQPLCPSDGRECVIQLEQSVDMVLDIERATRPRDDPIPRPLPYEVLYCDPTKNYPTTDACFPIDLTLPREWSLSSIFGRSIRGTCLASSGPKEAAGLDPSVCLNAPFNLEVRPSEGATIFHYQENEQQQRCFRLQATEPFDLLVPKQDGRAGPAPAIPPLFAERSITGHGQERGGVQALLTNPSSSHAVEFIYFETLPWFMKPFLHTLRTSLSPLADGSDGTTNDTTAAHTDSGSSVLKDMYYRPGLDRLRGSQLELHLRVPARTTLVLAYEFEKAILRYTEYPPDANRGRDVAPAVIRILGASSGSVVSGHGQGEGAGDGAWRRRFLAGSAGTGYVRTMPLMLPLPTPDFSMPYNVIILTSTVIAIAFGNIYNLLVRRFVGADEYEDEDLKGRLRKALQRLRGRLLGNRAGAGDAQKEDDKKTQ